MTEPFERPITRNISFYSLGGSSESSQKSVDELLTSTSLAPSARALDFFSLFAYGLNLKVLPKISLSVSGGVNEHNISAVIVYVSFFPS